MEKKYLIGIMFKCLNCVVFPLYSLEIVYCAKFLSLHEVFFYRGLLSSVLCMILLKLSGAKIFVKIDRRNQFFYLARALLSIAAMYLWTLAIQKIGLNDATALSYIAPIWLTLAANIFFKEKFKLINFLLIFIGLIGIAIIIKPKFYHANYFGLAAAFVAIIFWVSYEIVCKKQTATENHLNQNLYTSFLSTLIILPFCNLDLAPFVKTPQLSMMLVLLSMIAIINVSLIFIAYSFTPMSILAPFTFLRLIFTCLITYYLHDSTLTFNFITGSCLILVTNSYFLYTSIKEKNQQ